MGVSHRYTDPHWLTSIVRTTPDWRCRKHLRRSLYAYNPVRRNLRPTNFVRCNGAQRRCDRSRQFPLRDWFSQCDSRIHFEQCRPRNFAMKLHSQRLSPAHSWPQLPVISIHRRRSCRVRSKGEIEKRHSAEAEFTDQFTCGTWSHRCEHIASPVSHRRVLGLCTWYFDRRLTADTRHRFGLECDFRPTNRVACRCRRPCNPHSRFSHNRSFAGHWVRSCCPCEWLDWLRLLRSHCTPSRHHIYLASARATGHFRCANPHSKAHNSNFSPSIWDRRMFGSCLQGNHPRSFHSCWWRWQFSWVPSGMGWPAAYTWCYSFAHA